MKDPDRTDEKPGRPNIDRAEPISTADEPISTADDIPVEDEPRGPNRAGRRAQARTGHRAGKPGRKVTHRRVPPPRDLPFNPGPNQKVRACACGWLTIGETADAAFAEHVGKRQTAGRGPEGGGPSGPEGGEPEVAGPDARIRASDGSGSRAGPPER